MKYIIRYYIKVNGKWTTKFHENITNSERKDTMNVYVEHITADKKKAKRFHTIEEADKIAKLFEINPIAIVSTVITVKK